MVAYCNQEQEATASVSETLLTDVEVSQILKRKRRTLREDRNRNIGVPYMRVGRHVRYRRSDVERFLASL